MKKVIALFLCLMLARAPMALAGEASLTGMTVTNTRDDLLLFLGVKGAFNEEIRTAVLSGVPTSFSFLVSLDEVRSMWFDRRVADIRVVHTIRYNNLKKEFSVTRSWDGGGEKVTDSFEKAQALMAEMKGVKVASLGELERGERYQLSAKAELSKVRLPLYLHYIIFFISFWDFETDWNTIDFIY